MFRGVAAPFAMFLAVAVVCVAPSLAAPSLPYSLSHEELIMSVIVNQMAILQGMNESSAIAAHYEDLNQLREDMEKEWQTMNETIVEEMKEIGLALQTEMNELIEAMKNKIKTLNETGESRARAISEMNAKIQSMDENMNAKIQSRDKNLQAEVSEFGEQMENEMDNEIDAINQTVQTGMDEMNNKIDAVNDNVQRWMEEMNEKRMNETQLVMKKLEALQNAAAFHHHRPDPLGLYVTHNDSYHSLCDGHKVLHGSRGAFRVTSSGNYANNMDCSWTVTLPEGSRPVFRWHYIDIQECSPCNCDYVYINDLDHSKTPYFCGDKAPDGSFSTVMNNKFKVKFHSDDSVTGRGFSLRYRAVSRD